MYFRDDDFRRYESEENRENMLEKHQPKVAGDDELEGGARHPQRFDEPDEEALEEMAKLLEEESDEKPDSLMVTCSATPF